jgi:formate hydrogenlyase subunit 6/NADH:ubiquinone oxidoreductase subunit I
MYNSAKKELMLKRPPLERINDFNEVEEGLKESVAVAEALRCLTCEIGICVGCKICAETCPDAVIQIQTQVDASGKVYVLNYTIDMTKCMFCGLCAECCPTKAVRLSDDFELACYDKNLLHFDLERLRIR